MNHNYENRLAFALGTGRCGTKFLSQLMELELSVSSVHERNQLNETFHRYCKWYGLGVDDAGFLAEKEREIQADLRHHKFSFESSALLALSVEELFKHFGCKFILLVRSPEKVINSYLAKGYYSDELIRADHDKAPGNQGTVEFHHFMGRIVPAREEYDYWSKLSRVGKIAWFWHTVNKRVLDQFANMPESHWVVQKLENLDHEAYIRLADFLGLKSTVSEHAFADLANERPNRLGPVPTTDNWTKQQVIEFAEQVKEVANLLGYSWNVDNLVKIQAG